MKMLVSLVATVLAAVSLAPSARAAATDPSGDLPHLRPMLDQTLETEKSGIEVRWSNPTTGNQGMIRVERTFYRDDRPCRDYLRTVETSAGPGWVIRGTACRVDRGRWEVRNEVPTETGERERPRTESRPAATATARDRRRAPVEPAAATAKPEDTPAVLPEDVADARAKPAERPAADDESGDAPADEPFVVFTRPARTGI